MNKISYERFNLVNEELSSFNSPHNLIILLDKNYHIIEINNMAHCVLANENQHNRGIHWKEFCQNNNIETEHELLLVDFNRDIPLNFKTTKKLGEISRVSIEWKVVSLTSYFILVGSMCCDCPNIYDTTIISNNKSSNAIDKIFLPFNKSIAFLTYNFKNKGLLQSILKQIVESLHEHANLKNENFEYLTLSPKSRNMLGISSLNDVIGCTVDTFKDLPKKYINQIHSIDEEAAFSKKAKTGIQGEPFINAFGTVESLVLNKIPLLDDSGNMNFLLTLSINSSSLKNPHDVRKLYRSIYREKRESCRRFLAHYNLDLFKHPDTGTLITTRELDVIMCLANHNNAKLVARDLKIDESTVRKHIEVIKLKMHCVNKLTIVEKFLDHVHDTNARSFT